MNERDVLRWLAEKRWRIVTPYDPQYPLVQRLIAEGHARRSGCNTYVTDAGRASLRQGDPHG